MIDLIAAQNALNESLNEVRRQVEAYGKPPVQEDIQTALKELLEATNQMDENLRLWDRKDENVYDNSEECRAHWSAALRRRDDAVRKLTQIARWMHWMQK